MLVLQVLREFAVEDFFSYKSRKRRNFFFYRRATYKDTYVEAFKFRQVWSVAKNKGDVMKTKEGGLSPQEGDVRIKKEKKDQGRREGGSAKARFRVS